MSEYKWKPFTLLVSAKEVKGNEMKIGDKYRFIGEPNKHGFYTKGKVYEITNIFEGGLYMEDNFGKAHSWNEESVNEKFEPVSSPIRTVTRREIVPGVYGRLHVSRDFSMEDKNLRIALSDCLGKPDPAGHYWNLDELDEAIHTLSQIREVIAEESGK